MKQKTTMQFERHVKAPKGLKRKTFKKIERLGVMLELLGFYSSIPHSFFDTEIEGDTRTNKH